MADVLRSGPFSLREVASLLTYQHTNNAGGGNFWSINTVMGYK